MTETRRSIKGHLRAFKINIKNGEDPLIQLQETQPEVNRFLGNLLGEMGGLSFLKPLRLNLVGVLLRVKISIDVSTVIVNSR